MCCKPLLSLALTTPVLNHWRKSTGHKYLTIKESNKRRRLCHCAESLNRSYRANSSIPRYGAEPFNSDSIANRRLYLATRSERHNEPVLI